MEFHKLKISSEERNSMKQIRIHNTSCLILKISNLQFKIIDQLHPEVIYKLIIGCYASINLNNKMQRGQFT